MGGYGRKNKTNFLIFILFALIMLLLAAVGLRLNLGEKAHSIISIIGIISTSIVTVLFIVGITVTVVKNKKKIIPSKIRDELTSEFNFAEDNFTVFLNRLSIKNFIFGIYFFIVSIVGLAGFGCISFCLFAKPWLLCFLPLIIICITPLWRKLEYFLRKGNDNRSNWSEILTEYPETLKIVENAAQKAFGKKVKIQTDFGYNSLVKARWKRDTLMVSFNTYIFYLLTKEEITACLIREFLLLKDKTYRKITKIISFGDIYKNDIPYGLFFAGLFSFVIEYTITHFDFARSALSRGVEKIADSLIKDTEYAKDYITAYKKNGIFNSYLGDSGINICLEIYRNGEDSKYFTSYVFNRFVELYREFGEKWANQVERKLKALVTDSLVYSEKILTVGVEPDFVVIENNATEEMKCLYDRLCEYGAGAFKAFYEAKKEEFDSFDRLVLRYEQNSDDYDERRKLIEVAHAYVTMNELQKAEEVYKKILAKDGSPESNFDYGAFLLSVKQDPNGVDYIYKAMENENLINDGFEILGRYFILSGDREGYEKFSKFKKNKMDEIAGAYNYKDMVLNENSALKHTEIDDSVITEIVDVLSKDDNINRIYCADGKTQSGKPITLFGIAVRNKTEGAFYETYERVFSILDNDYGKYDTFLVSTDKELNRKIVKKLIEKDEFLKFDR